MEALKEAQQLATVCLPVDLCSILILLKLLNFKTRVTRVTAHYAVTMAAVLALGRSVVESVSVMRVMDAVTITVSSLPIPVATAAVTVQRAKDALVTTTQIRSFAALQVVELDLLLRRLNPNLLLRR
jgi:hypothetical protein